MVSNMKLGGSFFDKEKKIISLTEENKTLKQQLEETLQENQTLKTSNTELERKVKELGNNVKLKELEFGSLDMKHNKLRQEMENMNKKFSNLDQTNVNNKDKVVTMNNEIDSLNNTIQILQNLEIRLRKEIEASERKNIEFEKKVENMEEMIVDKEKKIEILERSLEQKNRHISVLVKEKDRIVVNSGNKENGIGKSKGKEEEKGDVKKGTLEERKKRNELSEYNSVSDDKAAKNRIVNLENEVKEKEKELEKVKKENFQLMTRLRNAKVK